MDRIIRTLLVVALLVLTSGCASTSVSHTRPAELRSTAEYAYRAGDLISAEGLLREALSHHARDADSWFLLGNIYLRTRQYAAAENAYRQAAQLKPEQAQIWHNLAIIHIRQATQTLLEGQRHVDDDFEPLLGWLLQVQGVNKTP
ncbi:tetratricopeptide repeat protein [Aliidiomarina sp. Khilg15.8]